MKIVLLGDSIRFGPDIENGTYFGYGYYVRRLLKDKAEVFEPDENCRFLQYTLRYLSGWAEEFGDGSEIDIVHWNNGLWDVLRLLGDDVFTPPEMYELFLVRVHRRIRQLFPNARVIFALTTPVLEKLSDPSFTRRNADIERYNEIAQNALVPLGVEINDLYTAGRRILPQHHSDWVHYDRVGAQLLAEQVVKALKI